VKRRGTIIVLVALVLALMVTLPGVPRTRAITPDTLTPTEDAFVDSTDPNGNFGSETVLAVYDDITPTVLIYTYLRFDISTYEHVESATLRMYCEVSDDPSTDEYTLKEVTNVAWDEDTVNHNNKPAVGDTLYEAVTGATGWKEWDVTDYVEESVLSEWDFISFELDPDTPPFSYGAWFNFTSKEGASNEPELVVYGYPEDQPIEYNLYGAVHEETGSQDSAINCTLTRVGESPRTVEVDGWYNITETESQVVWKFDLGNNVTRTFYCLPDVSETIYAIRPDEPYYTYSFNIIDFVGVEDAYLETMFNIEGTDWVVERWNVTIEGDLPFTLTWGNAYQLRLRCDRGTYYYPPIVATSDQNIILEITGDMFPVEDTDIGDLTNSGTRVNSTYIQGVYADALQETTWINMSIYEAGDSTVIASTNVSDYSLTWNWYYADASVNYYLRVLALHERRGLLEWVYVCPIVYAPDNPWSDLDTLAGDFLIAPSQLLGLGILGVFIGGFSWKNSPVGLIAINIIAMVLQYYNWIDFGWTWLGVSFTISILISLALLQERKR